MFYKWFFIIWLIGWLLASMMVSILRADDYKRGWRAIVINVVTSVLAGLASWGVLFVILADRIEFKGKKEA